MEAAMSVARSLRGRGRSVERVAGSDAPRQLALGQAGAKVVH